MSAIWNPNNWKITGQRSGWSGAMVSCTNFVEVEVRGNLEVSAPGALCFYRTSSGPNDLEDKIVMKTRVGEVHSLMKDEQLPSSRYGEYISEYTKRVLPYALETMKDFWDQFPFQEVLDLLDPESLLWDITEWDSCEDSNMMIFQGRALKITLSLSTGYVYFEIPGASYVLGESLSSRVGGSPIKFKETTKSRMQHLASPFEEMMRIMKGE